MLAWLDDILSDGSEAVGEGQDSTQQWLQANGTAYDAAEGNLQAQAQAYNDLIGQPWTEGNTTKSLSQWMQVMPYGGGDASSLTAFEIAMYTAGEEYGGTDYYQAESDRLDEQIDEYNELCKENGSDSVDCRWYAKLQEVKITLNQIHQASKAYLELEAGLVNAANADLQRAPDEDVEDIDWTDMDDLAELRDKLKDKIDTAKETAFEMGERKRRNFKEHCYMLAFADKFAARRKDARFMLSAEPEYLQSIGSLEGLTALGSKANPGSEANACLMLEGDSFGFMNKLTANPNQEAFFEMSGSDLAHLQPMIRLYKVLDTSSGLRSTEIEFESHFGARRDDLNRIAGGARMAGAGIKSFNFTYTATNPFATKKSISGQLVLFANGFEDLTRLRQNKRGDWYRFTDLALKTASNAFVETQQLEEAPTEDDAADGTIRAIEELNKLTFRLRAVVGWSNPPGNTELSDSFIKEALYDGHTTLNLTPTTHEFNIDEQGRVTMTINYLAYIDDAFDAHAFSVFNEPTVKWREAYRNMQIRSVECTAEKNKIKQFYKDSISEDKQTQLKWLLNEMNKRQKIFYTALPTAVAAQFADGDLASVRNAQTDGTMTILTSAVDSVTDPPGPQEIFSFFYISDLIDVIMAGISKHFEVLSGHVENAQSTWPVGVYNSYPNKNIQKIYAHNLKRYQEEYKKLRVLLGPMHFVSSDDGNPTTVATTLGDVALPVRFFAAWLKDKLESRNETNFPLSPFISTLLNELVRDYLNNDKCFDFSIKQKVSMQQAAVTGYGSNGVDPIMARKGSSAVLNLDNIKPPATSGSLSPFPILRVSGRNGEPSTDPDFADEFNYMIYFIGNMLPNYELTGNRQKDRERGIFHYMIGKDRGIIKGINLTKTDLTGLKEVRFESEGWDGLQQLREVYNANIDCYANVHAYPGTYIYVEPKGWAPQSDSDVDLTQLGLGGYYMIITAENNFGPGQADTKIVAKWVASKDGAKNPMLGPAIASKCRQKAEAASSIPSEQAADGYQPVYFEGTVEEPPPEAEPWFEIETSTTVWEFGSFGARDYFASDP